MHSAAAAAAPVTQMLLPVMLLLLAPPLLLLQLFSPVAAPFSQPWRRTPLKASPGVGRPEVISGNRSSGVLTDAEVAWLAATHELVVLSGATQDPTNESACGELRIADAARRLKAANSSVRVFVYFPSSKDEAKIQHYCGEDAFTRHPEWRVKLSNGSDFRDSSGAFAHDLSQPVVRAWWIASATNASFFAHFDGVFADNAIANADQLITADKTRLGGKLGAALLAGQQALYSELRQQLQQMKPGASVIFNGIREGQGFAAIPNLLPHADGGEMEGWLNGIHQRFANGSLNPALVLPTMHALLNVSAQPHNDEKQVLLKAVPGGGLFPPSAGKPHWSAAEYRDVAARRYHFPLAAFLVLAGPRWLLDYTWGYRSYDYVPPVDDSGTVPGLPNMQSMAPLGWYPDFLRAPGTPLGPASYDGAYTFSREWTGVSVSVNVRDESATLTWK
jgi:hypothetical protein